MGNKIKVLFLTKYDSLGASSRVRLYQYFKYLEENNVSIKVSPLMPNSYIKFLMSGKKSRYYRAIYHYFYRFIYLIFFQVKYDLIFIEKELFPYIPYEIEKLLLWKPYILDYDDAVFHLYDKNKSKFVRFMYSNKIKKLMHNSNAVICGNQYLKEYALSSKMNNIYLIPTVVSKDRYIPKCLNKNNKRLIIGWIGSTTTEIYLTKIETALKNLTKNYDFELLCIGAKNIKLSDIKVNIVNWSEAEEVSLLDLIDIGIMPLSNGDFEKGKCGYKLIQYMALAKPVVASPVGVNADIVQNDFNGYLAENLNDWEKYLEILLISNEKRLLLGHNGRELFLKKYSIENYQELFLSIIINNTQSI